MGSTGQSLRNMGRFSPAAAAEPPAAAESAHFRRELGRLRPPTPHCAVPNPPPVPSPPPAPTQRDASAHGDGNPLDRVVRVPADVPGRIERLRLAGGIRRAAAELVV